MAAMFARGARRVLDRHDVVDRAVGGPVGAVVAGAIGAVAGGLGGKGVAVGLQRAAKPFNEPREFLGRAEVHRVTRARDRRDLGVGHSVAQ
jgi:hypothetical protein